MGTQEDVVLPTRKRKRTPLEELQWRLEQVSPPIRITAEVLAVLAWHTSVITITNNCELKLEHDGARHTFFHPHARHCQDGYQGRKVHVAFDPDFPELIHVMSADHRHVESIPAKNKVEWFDPVETSLAIEAQRQWQKRQATRAEAVLKERSEAELGRATRNTTRIERHLQRQITDSFPISPATTDGAERGVGPRVKALPRSANLDDDHDLVDPTVPASDRLLADQVVPDPDVSHAAGSASRPPDYTPADAEPDATSSPTRRRYPGAEEFSSLSRPNFGDGNDRAANNANDANAAEQIMQAERTARTRVARGRTQAATAAALYAEAVDDLAVSVTELKTTDEESDESW
jgi:hypothetical protein